MRDGPGIDPGLYIHLIDAEREALVQAGRRVDKIALIKALRGATSLGLADAKRAVEAYLVRRGGINPPGSDLDRPTGWIDDLLDAERAAASKADRPITKIVLIKALREASGLKLKPAKDAVEDYLRRKGGEGLPSGSKATSIAWLATVCLVIAAILAWIYR